MILPSREFREKRAKFNIIAATGHNVPGEDIRRVNELVALAEGALAIIASEDFTVLDCGARDVKYVVVENRRIAGMDWNTECGAFTGQLIELLASHFAIDMDTVTAEETMIPVVCGVLGMTAMFDEISGGLPHGIALARFLKGIAVNCEHLIGRPGRIFLSGGLCENRAFVSSFSMPATPLGRFVLVEGLRSIIARERSQKLL